MKIAAMIKYVYIILGFLSLTLGILGIVTPGLPTTPFILLTGFLFAKGSPRLHQKLKENKITGRYLNRMEGGFSLRATLLSIGVMWCMICLSAFLIFEYGWVRFLLIGLGVIGTFAQLFFYKRKKNKKDIIESQRIKEGTIKL